MGITVHYHGQMADLSRIEEMEDRVVDMALEIGADVRIWRSWPDGHPDRVVRGLTLNIIPGLETLSLLISPEGWLVPLMCIEDAEKGTLSMPPYCCCKTQFGPPEGHVAVVTLLDFIKREFFPELHVRDEAEYWEKRDLQALIQRLQFSQRMIDGLAKEIRATPLSPEAAEDPEILATRIARLAQRVHDSLVRPSEHPPVAFDDEDDEEAVNEAQWDAFYLQQRRKEVRIKRAIDEARLSGTPTKDAMMDAMRNEGLIDLPVDPDLEQPTGYGIDFDEDESELEPREEWRESLDEVSPLAEAEPDAWKDEAGAGSDRLDRPGRHPLVELASDLRVQLYDLVPDGDRYDDACDILMGAIGDVCGGLVQALCDGESNLDSIQRGLGLVQLKRALRGVAFANAALFNLQESGTLSQADYDKIRPQFDQIEAAASEILQRFRGK